MVPSPIMVLKMVQFLQINLHNSKEALAALLIRLATGNIYAVLIQEQCIVGNNICGLSTPYTNYFTPRERVNTEHAFLPRHTLTLIIFLSLTNATSPRSDWS